MIFLYIYLFETLIKVFFSGFIFRKTQTLLFFGKNSEITLFFSNFHNELASKILKLGIIMYLYNIYNNYKIEYFICYKLLKYIKYTK